jgi:hypothetical protein
MMSVDLDLMNDLARQIEKLTTQNKRYREALEKIATYTPYSGSASYGGQIARKALGQNDILEENK